MSEFESLAFAITWSRNGSRTSPLAFSYTHLLTAAILCVYINTVKLEWDDDKRSEALAERGLDFADVARVDWATAFTIEDTRLDYAEARFVTMAPINNRLCVFAWCQRGEALRVISLRKANKRERNKYEKAIHQP
jgi:uncharacterized protein